MATKREQLEKLVHDMKARAEELDAKGTPASPEELAEINKMGADVKSLIDTIKAEAEASGTLDVAKGFLADLAGAPKPPADAAPEFQDGVVNPKGMTLGEAFVKSAEYQGALSGIVGSDGRIKSQIRVHSKSYDVGSFVDARKAVLTGASATSGGALVINNRYGPVTDLVGERRLTVRDLCTNINIQSDTFEFVQVTGKTNNAAAVPEATSNADPADGIGPDAGELTAGGYKPESEMALAVVTAPVETIAHIMAVTRRAAADAPQMMQLVNSFLLYGLAEEEEDQILNGNGTSPNVRGILQTVGISTVGSAGTDLDAIVDAIRTVRADRREPNAMVIHPNDWFSTGFLLAKDTAGNYLVGNPRASLDELQSLWGLRVVVTPAMTENTALVGDFSQAVVADRQQATIYMTDSHKDWFSRNILAVLAEERLAVGVLDPDSFCTVTAL